MTDDNKDAYRLATVLITFNDRRMSDAAAHLRRLVRENEAKDALLRQAKTALGAGTGWMTNGDLIAAIREHLGEKA